jgi:Ca2+-binding RTX toxin-like protein
MSYSISGTTIRVSGTVDLMHKSLPEIRQIEFAAGGAQVTFSSWPFMPIPTSPTFPAAYTVVGSTSHDVLTISMIDHGPPSPFGPTFPEPDIDLGLFQFLSWGANDTIVLNGNSDDNYLWGSYRRDTINGGDGNDFLDSGNGVGGFADTLRGGNGDDTYSVHPSDIVDETGTDGNDTIRSYWSYSLLSPNIHGAVENLTLTAVDKNTNATGNDLDNKLVGGLADNILNGRGGDDYMQGRRGNDTYIVNSPNDVVDEKNNLPGGIDTVNAYVSYSLSDTAHVMGTVENLILFRSAAVGEGNRYNNALTGNGVANTLRGLDGNDILDGAGGPDQLEGGIGNDTYVLGREAAGVDKVVDIKGIDTITSLIDRDLRFSDYSEIENLALLGNAVTGIGNARSNVLTGDSKANRLFGFAGNDTLVGGVGADRLIGGLGADKFVFNKVTESRILNGRDLIADFHHAENDRIVLTAIDANVLVAGNQAFHFIGNAAFSHHAGELRYYKASGHTYIDGDINGDGAADLTIISTLPLNFVSADFAL